MLSSLVFPMFAMVLLTCTVLAMLFRSRVNAVKAGAIKASYYKTYQGHTEPDFSRKLSRHFTNIFEAPTLFYVACLAGMMTQLTSPIFLALAWLYVLLRAVHAYIHIGKNKMWRRIYAYMASWAVLLVMWIYLAAHTALT